MIQVSITERRKSNREVAKFTRNDARGEDTQFSILGLELDSAKTAQGSILR
jgi:hypothetical protein